MHNSPWFEWLRNVGREGVSLFTLDSPKSYSSTIFCGGPVRANPQGCYLAPPCTYKFQTNSNGQNIVYAVKDFSIIYFINIRDIPYSWDFAKEEANNLFYKEKRKTICDAFFFRSLHEGSV